MSAAPPFTRPSFVVALFLIGLAWAPSQSAFAAPPPKPSRTVKPVASQPKPGVPATKQATPGANNPLLPGANSKEPINIDAGKLDYFDKEQKLVYTGDVVAVQGESTLKSSVLTIFLQKDPQPPGAASAGPPAAAGPGGGSSVRHMEADGPVTLISKDQVGTGNHGSYDKAENKVYLTGNVTLSQGPNVTKGERLVYDMTSGQAQVFSDATTSGRVSSVFTPGTGAAPAAQPDPAPPPPKTLKPTAPSKRRSDKAGKPAAAQADDAATQ